MILDVIRGPFGHTNWEEVSEQLRQADGVILYHGTSSKFLENILSEGIKPREMTGNSTYEGREVLPGKSLESQPDKVYLIQEWGIGFGGCNAVNKWGGDLIGLRIFIPNTNKLFPDEDSKKETWHDSIAYEDSCAHKGIIKPENILGYYPEMPPENYVRLKPDPGNIQKLYSPVWY